MILNFSKKYPWGENTDFVNKIDDKVKIHSIREDKANRWKPKILIHLTTGARTKYYDCFNELECISTQSIDIEEMIMTDAGKCYVYTEKITHKNWSEEFSKVFKVTIDGRVLTSAEIDTLARNDGFNSTHDFFRWFNGNFIGKIIHWTDFKY
ncbi:hypothetical protein E2605_18655 [Dysgonomonas capnocytophagoides]|uniref:ASCH domain-containing protein n=1 Tax=Dysgonomonas capnocytophagoides TaxID=45254 RepID=A0A4Y8KVX6_9BACT|nr:hypothetical protein [Dysgonomonas capnocytophagoides]TFD92581.1 hypothetical protein E2605_18655 [Dysgonomonas capnocytophagoides]